LQLSGVVDAGGGNAGDVQSVADLDRMIAQSLRDVPDDDDEDLSDTDDPDLLVSHSVLSFHNHSHSEILHSAFYNSSGWRCLTMKKARHK